MRILAALFKLTRSNRVRAVVAWATTAIALPGQTFTTLLTFGGTDGANSYAGLVQGTDGNLYGTASGGGKGNNVYHQGFGTAFKITPTGALTTIHDFCSQGGSKCVDGISPLAGLVQATDGVFYGTTGGGSGGYGEVFKITQSGRLTRLYGFCSQGGIYCTDGAFPSGALVLGADGNLYGATIGGGSRNYQGTIFKITQSGVLTTLYRFCADPRCPDGSGPDTALIPSHGRGLLRDQRKFRRSRWWHNLQNHSGRLVDDTIQLQLLLPQRMHRRFRPERFGSVRRWRFLWSHSCGRRQQRGHSVQDHVRWHADYPL